MRRSPSQVSTVAGLCLVLTAARSSNAFLPPAAGRCVVDQRMWSGYGSTTAISMADKVKEVVSPTSNASKNDTNNIAPASSLPQYFFATSVAPEESSAAAAASASDEDAVAVVQQFDPLELSSNQLDFTELGGATTTTNIIGDDKPLSELENKGDELVLGIWASRALLLLVAMIWATNFASVKYLTGLCFDPPCHHPPSEAAFARFGVAAMVGLPLLWKQNKDVILAGLECGLFITLGYVSQSLALATISSGKCAFICSLTVVFVPIVSALVYGKPIKPMNLVAAAVALSGVGVLEGMIDFNSLLGIQPAVAETGVTAALLSADTAVLASSSMETAAAAVGPLGDLANSLGVNKGDLLALGQPIGFGYSFTRIEYYQEKFEHVPNRILTIAAAQCVAVGFISLLWVLYDFHGTIPDFGYMMEPHRIATVAWTGIVTTVIAIYMEGIALQTATATDAAITFASEPVWASLFGFLLLKEQLGTNSYIGGAIIMVACLIGALSDGGAENETMVLDVGATSVEDTEDFS